MKQETKLYQIFTIVQTLSAQLSWSHYLLILKVEDQKVKEEKFQTEFLQLIFENCLGYTLDSSNPSNFNLEREKKNETDSKKADGVISVNNEIVGEKVSGENALIIFMVQFHQQKSKLLVK